MVLNVLSNKNFEILSSLSLSYVEKYLQEIMALGFEYSSDYVCNYSFSDFKVEPTLGRSFFGENLRDVFVGLVSLLRKYLVKDFFFSSLYVYVHLKLKINFNQFMQVVKHRGSSGLNGCNKYLVNNLYFGLTVRDFILSSFGVRKSIMEGSFSTADSGYLTRRLIECLRDSIIKEVKCGSLYRCEDKYSVKLVKLPLLCLCNKSVCLSCLGLELSSFSVFGYNKGIISGQALGEPSTQMLLKTFHLGSSSVSGRVVKVVETKGRSFDMFFSICGWDKKVKKRFYTVSESCIEGFSGMKKTYVFPGFIIRNNYVRYRITGDRVVSSFLLDRLWGCFWDISCVFDVCFDLFMRGLFKGNDHARL